MTLVSSNGFDHPLRQFIPKICKVWETGRTEISSGRGASSARSRPSVLIWDWIRRGSWFRSMTTDRGRLNARLSWGFGLLWYVSSEDGLGGVWSWCHVFRPLTVWLGALMASAARNCLHRATMVCMTIELPWPIKPRNTSVTPQFTRPTGKPKHTPVTGGGCETGYDDGQRLISKQNDYRAWKSCRSCIFLYLKSVSGYSG